MEGVVCPLKSEQDWLNRFLVKYMKHFPGSVSILDSRISINRKISGIITNNNGEGIGIVSWGGSIERFPTKVSAKLVKMLKETGVMDIVESLSPGDIEQLAKQVETGYLLKHSERVPTGEEIVEIEEIKPISEGSTERIMEKISEGLEKKRKKVEPEEEEISSRERYPPMSGGLLESIRRRSEVLSSKKRKECPEGYYRKEGDCVPVEMGREAYFLKSLKKSLGRERMGLKRTARETEESCIKKGLYWSQKLGKCVVLSERDKFLKSLSEAAESGKLRRTGRCPEDETWDPRLRRCVKT